MSEEILEIEDLKGGTFNQKTFKIKKRINERVVSIVRKESDINHEMLISEIKYILLLKGNAKKYFPKILRYQTEKLPIFYEMPFYEMRTLRDIIFEGRINSDYCMEVIKNIIKFMFKEIFSQNISNTPKDYLFETTFSRIEERQKGLKEKYPELKKFIEAEKVIMHEKEYDNTQKILDKIKEDEKLIKILTPKKSHMIHGDFHFDNFLVDEKNPNKFILIDPIGRIKDYTYAYDLGKMWFSIHGLYDFINEGLYNLEYEIKDGKVYVKTFEFKNPEILKVFKEIYNRKKELFEICKKNLEDETINIELQILFSEATHFCSLAPFQLQNDKEKIKEGIARYLTGVKLLNEFMEIVKEIK